MVNAAIDIVVGLLGLSHRCSLILVLIKPCRVPFDQELRLLTTSTRQRLITGGLGYTWLFLVGGWRLTLMELVTLGHKRVDRDLLKLSSACDVVVLVSHGQMLLLLLSIASLTYRILVIDVRHFFCRWLCLVCMSWHSAFRRVGRHSRCDSDSFRPMVGGDRFIGRSCGACACLFWEEVFLVEPGLDRTHARQDLLHLAHDDRLKLHG